MEQHEQLRKYNRWRRGDKRLKMPDSKELGELIDSVADRLEVLEREHAEFFERWRTTLSGATGCCCRSLTQKAHCSRPRTSCARRSRKRMLRRIT